MFSIELGKIQELKHCPWEGLMEDEKREQDDAVLEFPVLESGARMNQRG